MTAWYAFQMIAQVEFTVDKLTKQVMCMTMLWFITYTQMEHTKLTMHMFRILNIILVQSPSLSL